MGLIAGNFSDQFSQDNNLNNWHCIFGPALILSNGLVSGAASNQTLCYNQTVTSSDTGEACSSVVIGAASTYAGQGVYGAVNLSDSSGNNYAGYYYWYSSSVGFVVQLAKSSTGWLGPYYPITLAGYSGDTIGICSRNGHLSISHNGIIMGTYDDSASPFTNLYPAIYFHNATSNWSNGWQISLADGYTQTHNVLASVMLSGSTAPCTGNCPSAMHTPSLTVQTTDNRYGGTVNGPGVSPPTGINLPNNQIIPLDEFVGTPGVIEVQGGVLCSVAGRLPASGNENNNPILVWTLEVDDGQSGSANARKVHSYCRNIFGNPHADFNPVEFWLPEGVSVSKYYYARGLCFYLDNQGTLDPNSPCHQANEGESAGDPRVHQVGWSSTPNPACCTKISESTVCNPPAGHPEP